MKLVDDVVAELNDSCIKLTIHMSRTEEKEPPSTKPLKQVKEIT
nr:hypothetical protein [Maridesulfovibrio sp.]